MHSTRSRGIVALTCLAALAAAGCQDEAESPFGPELSRLHDASGEATAFGVYSQNVYLGGDTGPLFTLDFNDLGAVLAATNPFWADVQASDVPGRVSAFADEIERRLPHVVALQEALQFVEVDATTGQPIAVIDFLAQIQGEIEARGLPYELALVQAGTSEVLPLAVDPAVGITRALSFTDRVAILKRTDVTTLESDKGVYGASLTLGPVELLRAWARLTVEHDGVPHHFIATHLETQGVPGLNEVQGDELRTSVAAGLDGVTIIAGDLNSDAAVESGPSWTPTYGKLIDAGFTDVWATSPSAASESGVTCCRDHALGDTRVPDERIDFVLVRSAQAMASGRAMKRGYFRADLFGDDPSHRTESGLWPSDHAGVVATMRLPPPWR